MEPLQTRPDELDEVLAFLRRIFDFPADAVFIQPDHARWKYFAPRPDWDQTRSFIMRDDDGAIASHCYICPFSIWNGERWVTSFHIGDMAGNPKVPGAALLLAISVAKYFDTYFGIGGSTQALRMAKADRKVAQPYGTLKIYTRTLQPVAQHMAGKLDWKSPLRVGRDLAWNVAHLLPSRRGWTAERVERFGADLPAFDGSGAARNFLPCKRTPELLNYMLDCPAARFDGFLLRRDGLALGHLLTVGRGGVARIADLSVQSESVEDWAACYAVAMDAVRAVYPGATSVTAAAFNPFTTGAVEASGFRVLETIFTKLSDKQNLLRGNPLFPNLNMMDWDMAYAF